MFGNKYQIEYIDDVVKKDIPALPKTVKKMVQKAIEEKLILDPVTFGKPLQYSLKGHRRLRVSDYRIVYRIDKEKVIVLAIKHRKEVYQ